MDTASFVRLACRAATLSTVLIVAVAAVPAFAISRIAPQPLGAAADGDESGRSVALSGDTAAVAAPGMQAVPILYSGAVEVYRRNAGAWVSEALLVPGNPGFAHRFGYSIALEGDVLVVGALGCCSVSSIYTFVRTGSSWAQVDTMDLPAGVKPEFALSGDTLLLTGGLVYVRSGQSWTIQSQLTGDDGAFWSGVAIDGDTAVVADGESSMPGDDFCPFYAYVFTRSGGTWTRQSKFQIGSGNGITTPDFRFAISGDLLLTRTYFTVSAWRRAGGIWNSEGVLDPQAQVANFGQSMDLQGGRAAVGAPGIIPGSAGGSVFVFERSGNAWQRVARAYESVSPDSSGSLGVAVALEGTTILAGSPDAETQAGTSGKASVFEQGDGSWPMVDDLKQPSSLKNVRFGWSVARGASTLVVGAPQQPSGSMSSVQGAAYVFENVAGHWVEQATFRSTATHFGEGFGNALAIADDTIVVGSTGDNSETFPGSGVWISGAAYVYTRTSGGPWSQQERVTTGPGGSGFGSAVALSGNDLAVGETRGANAGYPAGRVHLYARSGSQWLPQTALFASDSTAGNGFGLSASLAGDTLLVGAPGSRRGPETNVGSVYVFHRSGGVWSEQAKLIGTSLWSSLEFGHAVALAGDTAVVAQRAGTSSTPQNRVYVFSRIGSTWSLVQTLLPPGEDAGFATSSVSITADQQRIVIGSPNVRGATYVYRREGSEWELASTLRSTDPDPADSDCFGTATAVSGDELAVGSPCEGDSTGAAYSMSIGDVIMANGFE